MIISVKEYAQFGVLERELKKYYPQQTLKSGKKVIMTYDVDWVTVVKLYNVGKLRNDDPDNKGIITMAKACAIMRKEIPMPQDFTSKVVLDGSKEQRQKILADEIARLQGISDDLNNEEESPEIEAAKASTPEVMNTIDKAGADMDLMQNSVEIEKELGDQEE